MKDVIGAIQVTTCGILVETASRPGCPRTVTQTGFANATVENLHEAARLLAAFMDLPYSDIAKECQRIHNQDQITAELFEMVAFHRKSFVAEADGTPEQGTTE
jgi:hypothetical protein